MIVTLTGANDFLRKRELEKLVADFVREYGDMALEQLDGEEVSSERMRESLESLPFLTTRKMVILREPSRQKAFTENIETILQVKTEATDLIIVEPKLDKRQSYYKLLKKSTDYREFVELDAAGLEKWATEYVEANKGEISLADARTLVDRLGINQQLLQNEIDKLLLYDSKITAHTIELLTDRLPQSTVFEMLDAAFAGKARRALELYKEQRALKVEPLAIIGMLSWQMHLLALVKAAGERSSDQVAKEAKLSPFVVRKTQTVAKKLTHSQIKNLISDLLQLDLRLKTTAIDADEALQHFILKLSS